MEAGGLPAYVEFPVDLEEYTLDEYLYLVVVQLTTAELSYDVSFGTSNDLELLTSVFQKESVRIASSFSKTASAFSRVASAHPAPPESGAKPKSPSKPDAQSRRSDFLSAPRVDNSIITKKIKKNKGANPRVTKIKPTDNIYIECQHCPQLLVFRGTSGPFTVVCARCKTRYNIETYDNHLIITELDIKN
jgi:phage FluMu protein Com